MAPDVLFLILLAVISLLISLFGSLVGFGGAIFMVPIMIAFFGFELDIAVGAAMISLIPSSLISTYLNRKEGRVDFKMGVLLEMPTMIGVIVGSLLLTYISPTPLKIIFVLMLGFIGASFLLRKNERASSDKGFFYRLNKLKPRYVIRNEENKVAYRISLYMVLFFGMAAGTVAGLFGVGGGFMKTPIMLKVFKIPAKIAAATTLFMIAITSITGTVSHALQGHVILAKAWPVMLGFALGALIGHKVNAHLKDSTLESLVGISLISAGLMMCYSIFF